MELLFLFIIFAFGAVIGSFISAYTYRLPREESVATGRSYCDSCRAKINWYDNIPLLSYLLLRGKSRCCGKKISIRYPLIEFGTATIFLIIYLAFNSCFSLLPGSTSMLCNWKFVFGEVMLLYFIVLAGILVSIFVIDMEHQIIPDNLVFWIFGLTFAVYILTSHQLLYEKLLVGLIAACFFLFLHLITLSKGMGLGDVKLVLALAFILGWPTTLLWLFLSFVLGAVVGLIMIAFQKTKFGKHIAFGPFLIISFFIVLIWGPTLLNFFPFLYY